MNTLVIIRSEILEIIVVSYLIIYNLICRKFHKNNNQFLWMSIACLVHCIFALVTEITVNSDNVPSVVNDLCHVAFFAASMIFCYHLFKYVLHLIFTPSKKTENVCYFAMIICAVAAILMPCFKIRYIEGRGTNYSLSPGAGICFGTGLFILISCVYLLIRYRKRLSKSIYFNLMPLSIISIMFLCLQIVIPELLFSGGVLTMIELGVFLSMENPLPKLYSRAYMDGDTGTLNRNAYYMYYDEVKEKIQNDLLKEDIAYVFCDINSLKKINDEYGHIEGDRQIIATANAMKSSMTSCKNIYRIGGDEFVAIYEDVSQKQIEEEIQKLRECCKKANENLVYPLTIAVGFAQLQDGESIYDLVKRADQQMYIDKKKYYDENDIKRNR